MLNKYREQYELGTDDELWLAIDRDRWALRSLKIVARQCHVNGFGLALNNPCFEVWLSMHYTPDIPDDLDGKSSEMFFRQHHGSYSKSNFDPTALIDRVPSAISVAKGLDTQPNARWPASKGSRVYRLAESIINHIR
jgi:hypothetical protein